MSSPVNDDAEWTIHYHGGGKFKGRGEFLVLMLEDKGVPYNYVGENLVGPDGSMHAFRESVDAILKGEDDGVFPVFFPPALHYKPKVHNGEEIWINQVPACLQLLASALGYAATSGMAEEARVNCIVLNVNDCIAEGRSSFHPINDKASYSVQRKEGDEASQKWCKTRMLLWLAYFEKICRALPSPQSPIAGGPQVTQADFCLYHLLDATKAQFDTEYYDFAWTNLKDATALKEFYASFRSRPNIKAYIESGRERGWCGDSMM